MKRTVLFLLCMLFIATLFAQRTIKGKVTDEKGNPIANVSVKVKGTSFGEQASQDGSFSIQVPQNARTLVFTSIGFEALEANITSATNLSVTLTTVVSDLENVVVTGYTREKLSKYSGATSKVGAAKINQIPLASFDQILQGNVPGLYASASSGQPGAAANVIIRGIGSINGTTQPLYILDGMPIETSVFSTLNPADFESVDVLKDASATALYGSRASNGVIVISTKRGKAGKTKFNFKSQAGTSHRTRPKFEMMNVDERLRFEEEVGEDFGASIGPGWDFSRKNPDNASLPEADLLEYDRILDSLRALNVDWTDIVFRTGKFQQHEVNASGGTDRTRFYTSMNYFKQEGIALRSFLERFTFRNNLDFKTDKFTAAVNSSLGYSRNSVIESENTTSATNPFASVYYALPYEYPYRNGVLLHSGNSAQLGGHFDSREGSDGLERLFATTSRGEQIKIDLGTNARYQIVPALAALARVGIDYRQSVGSRFINPTSFTGSQVTGGKGSFGESFARNLQLSGNAGLVFSKIINKSHEVELTGLYEIIKNYGQGFTYAGLGIDPLLPNTPAGITPGTTTNGFIPTVGGSRTRNAFASLIGLGRYTYLNKYTATFSYRYDGSSTLGKENRWKGFYAAGVVWNVMEENFMSKYSSFLNSLNLRASYGMTASPFSRNFGYLRTYSNASTYKGVAGISQNGIENPDYDWEFAKTFNVGMDFSFWQRRARVKIDLYNKRTENLFITQSLSATSGFPSNEVNAGAMRNRGIEVEFDADIVRTKDLQVNVGGNFGYNKNRIVDLGQVEEFILGTSIVRVGLPFGSHFIPKWAGVDASTGDALYYDKEGKITLDYNSSTMSVAEFGTYVPSFTGGFNSSIRYKGFSLQAFFSFASGNKRFNNEDFFNENFPTSNQSKEMLTRWRKPGDITNIQSLASSREFSSKDIQDASYLRLRNLNLGYQFPAAMMQRLKFVDGISLFAQAQNLYTWTKWKSFDPEDSNNIATFEYPAARTFTFGINVSF